MRTDEIRKRLGAATSGPWEVETATEFANLYIKEIRGSRGRVCRIWDGRTCEEANAAFIAAAPEDISYLLARVEKLEGLLSRLLRDGVTPYLAEEARTLLAEGEPK